MRGPGAGTIQNQGVIRCPLDLVEGRFGSAVNHGPARRSARSSSAVPGRRGPDTEYPFAVHGEFTATIGGGRKTFRGRCRSGGETVGGFSRLRRLKTIRRPADMSFSATGWAARNEDRRVHSDGCFRNRERRRGPGDSQVRAGHRRGFRRPRLGRPRGAVQHPGGAFAGHGVGQSHAQRPGSGAVPILSERELPTGWSSYQWEHGFRGPRGRIEWPKRFVPHCEGSPGVDPGRRSAALALARTTGPLSGRPGASGLPSGRLPRRVTRRCGTRGGSGASPRRTDRAGACPPSHGERRESPPAVKPPAGVPGGGVHRARRGLAGRAPEPGLVTRTGAWGTASIAAGQRPERHYPGHRVAAIGFAAPQLRRGVLWSRGRPPPKRLTQANTDLQAAFAMQAKLPATSLFNHLG
jgi:hypothetical protein